MTPVEWLIDRIAESEKGRYYIPYNSGTKDVTELVERAKQMEREASPWKPSDDLPYDWYNEEYAREMFRREH